MNLIMNHMPTNTIPSIGSSFDIVASNGNSENVTYSIDNSILRYGLNPPEVEVSSVRELVCAIESVFDLEKNTHGNTPSFLLSTCDCHDPDSYQRDLSLCEIIELTRLVESKCPTVAKHIFFKANQKSKLISLDIFMKDGFRFLIEAIEKLETKSHAFSNEIDNAMLSVMTDDEPFSKALLITLFRYFCEVRNNALAATQVKDTYHAQFHTSLLYDMEYSEVIAISDALCSYLQNIKKIGIEQNDVATIISRSAMLDEQFSDMAGEYIELMLSTNNRTSELLKSDFCELARNNENFAERLIKAWVKGKPMDYMSLYHKLCLTTGMTPKFILDMLDKYQYFGKDSVNNFYNPILQALTVIAQEDNEDCSEKEHYYAQYYLSNIPFERAAEEAINIEHINGVLRYYKVSPYELIPLVDNPRLKGYLLKRASE